MSTGRTHRFDTKDHAWVQNQDLTEMSIFWDFIFYCSLHEETCSLLKHFTECYKLSNWTMAAAALFLFFMKITFCLHLIVVQWRFTGVERGWKDIQQRAIGHIQTRASLLQPCGCLLADWAKLAHWLLFVMMSSEESAVLERFEMFIIWPFLMMNMSSWDFS